MATIIITAVVANPVSRIQTCYKYLWGSSNLRKLVSLFSDNRYNVNHKHCEFGLMVKVKVWWKWAALGMLQVTFVSLYWPAMPVSAASTGAISQSYTAASSNIAQGTLLSLTSSGSGTVEPAQAGTTATNLVGVAAQSPLVELSDAGKNSVQVVVSGSTLALVSDINGPVVVGDKITISPLDGIGMKATQSGATIGVAQTSLSSVTTATRTVSGKDGHQVSIKVGLVPVAVNVTYYPAAQSGSLSTIVPPVLQSAANSLAGRQVAPVRVLLAALALVLGFIITVVMLTTSIRSEIVSLGRNPLARRTLLRALIDVLIAACGVLLVSLAAAVAVVWTN